MTRPTRRVLAATLALSLAGLGLTAGALAQTACDPFQTTPVYSGGVRTSSEVIGFELGSQQVTSAESDQYLEAVDQDSNRVVSGTAATSVGGKPIKYAIVGEPENVTPAGLAAIQANIDALRDPQTTDSEAAHLTATTPAIFWDAANVHGNEESGTDAALQVLYDLADRTDCAATQILENAIVVIMPTQNPDGRDEGTRRNLNAFDMNRDWFARTQPETDGKIELIRQYPPQLFIDDHEMGTKTFFFPPNADPIYHEVSDQSVGWINDIYGASMAAEFERQDIPFFHYVPYDFFAMIYGDTVPDVGFGAAGMTFEKHSGDPLSVRLYEQYVAVWTSLSEGALNREQILTEWHGSFVQAFEQGQQGLLEPNFVQQPGGELVQQVPDIRIRHYFIRDDDPEKAREVQRLVRRLQRMEVEVHELTAPLTVPDFREYGRAPEATTLPPGTYWIPMAQAQKHWVQALMHEDPYIATDITYDVSAWSNPLLMNVPAGFSGAVLSPAAAPVPPLTEPAPPVPPADPPTIALFEMPISTTGFESAGHLRFQLENAWGLDALVTDVTAQDIRSGGLATYDILIVSDGYLPYAMQALGKVGKNAIADWVNAGGRFIGYRRGAELGVKTGVSTAVLRGNHSNMPGTLVRVALDESSPLAEGVGPFAYVMFEEDSVMRPGKGTIAPITYPAAGTEDFFTSGLAVGADELGGTAWAVDESVGQGRSIVFSTDPNFRAWPDGTQKILWNAIFGPDPVSGAAARVGSARRASAEARALEAARALPTLRAPMHLTVARADARRTARVLDALGARFTGRDAARSTSFLIGNPRELAPEEHPFAATLVGDLERRGVDVRYFHTS